MIRASWHAWSLRAGPENEGQGSPFTCKTNIERRSSLWRLQQVERPWGLNSGLLLPAWVSPIYQHLGALNIPPPRVSVWDSPSCISIKDCLLCLLKAVPSGGTDSPQHIAVERDDIASMLWGVKVLQPVPSPCRFQVGTKPNSLREKQGTDNSLLEILAHWRCLGFGFPPLYFQFYGYFFQYFVQIHFLCDSKHFPDLCLELFIFI